MVHAKFAKKHYGPKFCLGLITTTNDTLIVVTTVCIVTNSH